MQDNYSLKTTNAKIAANYIIMHTNKYTLTKIIEVYMSTKKIPAQALDSHSFLSRLFHGLPNSLMVGQYQPLHFVHDFFKLNVGLTCAFQFFWSHSNAN